MIAPQTAGRLRFDYRGGSLPPQRLLNRLPVRTARDRCAIVRAARIGRGRSAVDVDLSSAELNRIAAELPKAAGERYTPEGMASVSS
jgi:hypothetical protein